MAEKHYGIALQEARERTGLSQKRLALLADVSRATLALAEQGANIELDTLRKITATLGITEIDIGGLKVRADAGAVGITPAVLAPIADEIERQAEMVRRAAGSLRSLASSGVGKSTRNDTPSREGISHLAAHLADLVYEFAKQVQRETDPKKLERLERDVSGLLQRDTA